MHFVVIGVSHKTAPLEIRERIAVPVGEISEVLRRFLENEDIQEVMLVSTCNRVEAYLVSKHVHRGVAAARQILSGQVGLAEMEKHLYVKEGAEAIAHLFRVTASLDSMVVGEPQISGQIKEAYTHAVSCHTTGPYLNKLVHKALGVSKKIRTETGIGQLPVSVSYAAVLLAEKIFGDLRETKVFLLGAGEMGVLAARHLAEREVRSIWIANRTGEKASLLATSLGATPVPYDEVPSKLSEADILIASTAAPEFVIREEEVREAMRRRRNQPMFFIDIAVPRNIEPRVNRIENVFLYDIDHLQGIVETNLKEREKEARRAEGIIGTEVPSFLKTISEMALSPTIRELSKKFDFIRKNELEKYLARHPDLASKERTGLEACTRAIVNKILHEPIVLMKTEEVKEGGPRYSEILKKLFRLEGGGDS